MNNEILNKYESIKIPVNELAQQVKFPELLKENGKYVAIKNLGLVYKDEIEKCADYIKQAFDNLDGAHITHEFMGEPVRIQLDNISIVENLCEFFKKLTGDNLTEITVTRNCSTNIFHPKNKKEFIEGCNWMSELWHLDVFKNGNYKIGIYLNDILSEDNAPFEYYGNPNIDFYKSLIDENLDSRLYGFNPEVTTKVLAPKYTTLIFSPSFIHKGNYARNGGYRDFIMLGFNQF